MAKSVDLQIRPESDHQEDPRAIKRELRAASEAAVTRPAHSWLSNDAFWDEVPLRPAIARKSLIEMSKQFHPNTSDDPPLGYPHSSELNPEEETEVLVALDGDPVSVGESAIGFAASRTTDVQQLPATAPPCTPKRPSRVAKRRPRYSSTPTKKRPTTRSPYPGRSKSSRKKTVTRNKNDEDDESEDVETMDSSANDGILAELKELEEYQIHLRTALRDNANAQKNISLLEQGYATREIQLKEQLGKITSDRRRLLGVTAPPDSEHAASTLYDADDEYHDDHNDGDYASFS